MRRPYICIAGKNNISVDVLKYVVEHYGKENVCVVCDRTDNGENTFQRSLRKYSKLIGVPEHSLKDLYDVDDLVFLSLEFDRIINPKLFKNARLYNIHFSLLPLYKGMYTSVYPLLNGERDSGVTLHFIDEGIDTGAIIDQERFCIEDCDCKSLYLRYINYGTRVVIRNIDDIVYDRAIGSQQKKHGSCYYPKESISFKNIKIDLNQTADGIQRQLRAYSFRDYQLPKVYGREILDTRILDSKSSLKSGEVIFETDSFLIVSTIDYDIVLYFDLFEELLKACEEGDLKKVRDICSVNKHINEQDKNGWSPIIKATYYNHKEIVEYLIANGADIHIKNRNGTNLLMYAKDAYKKSRDNYLFKKYRLMGLSENEVDYAGKSLIDYLEYEDISFDELIDKNKG